jgi:hypothetical protein
MIFQKKIYKSIYFQRRWLVTISIRNAGQEICIYFKLLFKSKRFYYDKTKGKIIEIFKCEIENVIIK